MNRLAALITLAAASMLAGCNGAASVADGPPPDYSRVHDKPELAFLDNLLTVHEASQWNDGTSTCAARYDGANAVALAFEEEAHLMAKHIWLSPMDPACTPADGQFRDPNSDTYSQVVEVSGVECSDDDHCSGIGSLLRGGGQEQTAWRQEWRQGRWHFHQMPAVPESWQ